MRRWLRSRRWAGDLREWFIAWFGGSAVVAFQLGRPDLGWLYLAIAVVMMVIADVVTLVRAGVRKVARR